MELKNSIHITAGRIFYAEDDVTNWVAIDPCRLGHHRWAWLVDGTIACGYCEVRGG